MTTSRTAVREILAYLGLAYALALLIAVGLPHAHINLLLSVMVPTVTVGALTFTMTPRGSRRALWRGIGLGRAGLRAWPAAFIIPLLLCAGAYGTAVLTGAGRLHLGDLSGTAVASWTVNLLASLVIGTVIIVGEEIGWRGYLLPRFQRVTTHRRAAVATGFAHGCFHLPLILLATPYDTGVPRWVAAPVAVAVITAGGVFYAWLWDRTGTVWPVAIAHNVVNTVFDVGAAAVLATSGSSLAYVAGETGFATLGVCVLAAIALLWRAGVWRPVTVQPAQLAQAAVPAMVA